VNAHKKELSQVSTGTLLARRRRLADRLGEVEHLLAGSVTEQTRRCGREGCRCADGRPHGPYTYFVAKTSGRSRLRYVPAGLVATVTAWVARGDQVQQVLAEIAAINAELLARRELR
jgi:hypothetical protein